METKRETVKEKLDKNVSIKESIKAQSIEAGENECCGILIELADGKLKNIPAENRSKNPTKHFVISYKDFEDSKKQGKPIAIYHSHEKGVTFSELDKIASEKLNLDYIIYSKKEDEFKYYKPSNYEVPLNNRPHIPGVFDCLTFVIDYYRRKLNINLPPLSFEYSEIFININEKWDSFQHLNTENNYILRDYFLENGFFLVDIKNMKEHDVILAAPPKFNCAVHCLIWKGNNIVAHHPSDKGSLTEPISNFWKKRIKFILRHNLMA